MSLAVLTRGVPDLVNPQVSKIARPGGTRIYQPTIPIPYP